MDRTRPGPVEEAASFLKELPKEVAALLISVGALGVVLPGMAGLPAVIAGGLVFWPKTFGPLETWLGRKYPKTHRQSMEQIRRYLNDLEHRYPTEKRPPPPSPTDPITPRRPRDEPEFPAHRGDLAGPPRDRPAADP